MAIWSREQVEAVCQQNGWLRSSREIQNGLQFTLSDGTTINWYTTGKVVAGGKKTTMRTEAEEAFGVAPPPQSPASPSRCEPPEGGLPDPGRGPSTVNHLMDLKPVTVYTDGACIGNPGPGGYGVVLLYKEHRRELSAGYRKTTNNRMEILAAIVALEALKEPCKVALYSDSEYVVNSVDKGWARKWRKNGWRRNSKKAALNPDLWERLLGLCELHEVEFIWVKGHAGNIENERCDRLAIRAAQESASLVDTNYEPSGNGAPA